MNCPKCGLMNTGNMAVGLAMPQCMCQWQSTQEKSRIETVPAQGGLLPTMQEGKDFTITHPPQRTEQEPVGFAGIEMWIGNTRIKKLMTQTELHFAIDPWAIVKFNSDSCIDALKEKNT